MAYASFVNADPGTQPRGSIVRAGAAPGEALLAQANSVEGVTNLLGTRPIDVLPGEAGGIVGLSQAGMIVRMEISPVVGDVIYVSASTPGSGTPAPPGIAVQIGICYQVVNIEGVDHALVSPINNRSDREWLSEWCGLRPSIERMVLLEPHASCSRLAHNDQARGRSDLGGGGVEFGGPVAVIDRGAGGAGLRRLTRGS